MNTVSTTDPAPRRRRGGRPAWVFPTIPLFAFIGLEISALLVFAHYMLLSYATGWASATCPKGSGGVVITCTVESRWDFFGIPIPIWGALYFGSMLVLTLPWAWRSTRRATRLLRSTLAVGGLVAALLVLILGPPAMRPTLPWVTTLSLLTAAALLSLASTTLVAITIGNRARPT